MVCWVTNFPVWFPHYSTSVPTRTFFPKNEKKVRLPLGGALVSLKKDRVNPLGFFLLRCESPHNPRTRRGVH